MTEVADRLLRAAGHLASLADLLFDARTVLPGAWRGTAARTGAAEIDRISGALEVGTGRLHRGRGALLSAADQLARIRGDIEVLRHDWCRAEGEVRALENAVRTADCSLVAVPQEQLRLAVLRRDAALTGWRAAGTRADAATADCAGTLLATLTGAPVFRPGRGLVPGDLGDALGTAGMTADDVFRRQLARSGDDGAAWAGLGAEEQAFARATAGALPPVAVGPAARAAWWRSRSWAEQQAVLHDRPQAVGAADGLPARVRHQANLLELERWDAELGSLMDAVDREVIDVPDPARGAVLAGLQGQRDVIAAVRVQLALPRSQPVYLLAVDPAGRGRAVVAIGDPDTAAAVATYVPGTGSDWGTLDGELTRIDAWAAGSAEFGTHDVAAIAWIGYDSPAHVLAAAYDSAADAAAPALVAFQQGLRASHEGRPARATVVGHSYGGLVIAAAASGDRSLAADQVVLVGSTGLELGSVRDLHLDGVPPDDMADRVHAIRHENDAIQQTGFVHGGSPYEAEFGATVTIVEPDQLLPGWYESTLDLGPHVFDAWEALAAHGAYQQPGSVEQRLISAEIVGARAPVR